jgi:formamidopyrimidine-DNA glycosylase
VPELPEVETLRRDLSRTVVGRRIERAELNRPKMLVAPTGLALADLPGRTIRDLGRRAKLLLFGLSGDLTMAVHLKLAGQLIHRRGDVTLAAGGHPVPSFDAPMPHRATHGRFDLDDGSVLWLTDIRQFGRMTLVPTALLPALFDAKRLGIEPLGPEFTAERLASTLRRHRTLPIKSALLDQANLAGLGNIYADEALHAARVHPTRPAGALSDEEIGGLSGAIRDVLTYAIEHGVADLPSGRARDGATFPRAHGRGGMPCLSCGAPIERIRVGTRSTDFCPACQR